MVLRSMPFSSQCVAIVWRMVCGVICPARPLAVRYLSKLRSTERDVSLVWNEVDGVDNPAQITSDFVYLRLIGDRSISEDQFGKILKDRTIEIKKWVDKVKSANVSLAMVMLNNHFAGFAPGSANLFRKMIGLEELSFTDKKQKTLGEF